MKGACRVGVSADFKTQAPGLLEPVLDDVFAPFPFVDVEYFDAGSGPVPAGAIRDYDGVLTLALEYDAGSFDGNDRLAVLARWGVGYDMIDAPACTNADVLLAITTDAVRKPVAEAILTLILALAKKLPAKDKLVRTARWDLKSGAAGIGLSGKTVASLGLGNIAREMFRLLQPFDLGRRLAYDPFVDAETAAAAGVELTDLRSLFRDADFLAINCPLNDKTRGLVDAALLALMKPTAYLINTARGPIVNQTALTRALENGAIAGAGLDVFEEEPLPGDHPLAAMEQVILAPHALAWTDDLYRGNSVGACENVLTVLRGSVPRHTVNAGVVQRLGFQAKLQALGRRWVACTAG